MDIVEALHGIVHMAKEVGMFLIGMVRNAGLFHLGLFSEQGSGTIFLIVDCPGVGSKENGNRIAEVLLMEVFGRESEVMTMASANRFDRFAQKAGLGLGKNEPMKVIWHQAVANKLNIRQEMFPHFFQKKVVIPVLKENGLPIVALIIDMINLICRECHNVPMDFDSFKKHLLHKDAERGKIP